MAFVDGQTLTAAQLNAAFASLLSQAALQATAVVTEPIAANAFVNIYSSAGVLSVRNAIATDLSTAASGFVQSAYVIGQAAVINMLGINAGVTVTAAAIPGVWLSETVPGGFTTTQPTTTGHISQSLGQAMPRLGIFFTINPAYVQ
ncbi:hypothetical protein [Sphingomonas sp. 10B4]|uniref:hypothetical protein n=1 Tax=Sphingomonas sp. 10B4 TaxID=3048575 RepID=UPI002AB49A7D|nr:hypothetical protein [Sphingomonas sp. 10B4]MDY7525475.1 hypothetical protein [Sphingomonas sp. 10B4]MEB0281419.1 hypothetical protein [Sphingomonas sp. 10B4]